MFSFSQHISTSTLQFILSLDISIDSLLLAVLCFTIHDISLDTTSFLLYIKESTQFTLPPLLSILKDLFWHSYIHLIIPISVHLLTDKNTNRKRKVFFPILKFIDVLCNQINHHDFLVSLMNLTRHFPSYLTYRLPDSGTRDVSVSSSKPLHRGRPIYFDLIEQAIRHWYWLYPCTSIPVCTILHEIFIA